jgi:SagB-type dehydrogenase family enzyme
MSLADVKNSLGMMAAGILLLADCGDDMGRVQEARIVELPEPALESATSLEHALAARRSVRIFAPAPLSLAEVSQLCWAAQGITDEEGLRTAPSAGALYPLELYVVAGAVLDLAPGVYLYRPDGHRLIDRGAGDARPVLAAAALGQECIAAAPVVLVLAGSLERTAAKYGERAERYVSIEVGHAAQNVCLQAVALGLGTVMVGAFEDARVASALGLPAEEQPLALLPVGRPR